MDYVAELMYGNKNVSNLFRTFKNSVEVMDTEEEIHYLNAAISILEYELQDAEDRY